jgi:hypothetical protein
MPCFAASSLAQTKILGCSRIEIGSYFSSSLLAMPTALLQLYPELRRDRRPEFLVFFRGDPSGSMVFDRPLAIEWKLTFLIHILDAPYWLLT